MTKENKWTFEINTHSLADTGDFESEVIFKSDKDVLQTSGDDMDDEDIKKFCELLNQMSDLWSHRTDAAEFENSQLHKENAHLTAENTRLREALEKIAFPLTYLQREADKTGSKLNGVYANHLIQTVHHWREIAMKALTEFKTCFDCGTKYSSNERCPECNPMG